MTTFRLPDLGEGLTESEIVAWKVAEGDAVELNQVIAEVETAKAVVDLPSPYAGVIRRLHAGEGDTVEVGAPLVEYDVEGAVVEDPPAPEAPAPAATPAPADVALVDADAQIAQRAEQQAKPAEERVSVLVGSVKLGSGKRPTRRRRSFEQQPFEREVRQGAAKAFPPVRTLARQRGIDLTSVQATGEGGVVTRADLDRAGAAMPAQAAPSRASRRERVSGLRKHTAKAMVDSAFTAPHAACFLQVDVTATTELVADLKQRSRGGRTTSFLAMASRAIILAAKRTPGVNATFHADAGEIEYHERLNLGVAVATDRGLVVASVDDADLLDATALTEAIAARAGEARDGSISQAALTSSTMTVSNVGVFGVDGGIPILNPGESAIVALGTVRRMPWEHRGEIALRDVLTITVSFDHRVVDGKEASTFIADVGAVLERPGLALARG